MLFLRSVWCDHVVYFVFTHDGNWMYKLCLCCVDCRHTLRLLCEQSRIKTSLYRKKHTILNIPLYNIGRGQIGLVRSILNISLSICGYVTECVNQFTSSTNTSRLETVPGPREQLQWLTAAKLPVIVYWWWLFWQIAGVCLKDLKNLEGFQMLLWPRADQLHSAEDILKQIIYKDQCEPAFGSSSHGRRSREKGEIDIGCYHHPRSASPSPGRLCATQKAKLITWASRDEKLHQANSLSQPRACVWPRWGFRATTKSQTPNSL